MKFVIQLGLLIALAAGVCPAADSASAPKPEAATSVPGVQFVATLQNGFTVRFDHRRQAGDTSRLFTTADEQGFIDVPTAQIAGLSEERLPPAPVVETPRPALDIPAAIAAASDRHGIDADLLYSVIRAESGFKAKAVSNKGAQGLMQLMPGTASKLGVSDVFDPAANVDGGTRYLRELLARYNNDLVKALVVYNAGPQRVDQYHGVPPYRETRAYVARIIREYNRKKLAERRAAHRPEQSATARVPAESGN